MTLEDRRARDPGRQRQVLLGDFVERRDRRRRRSCGRCAGWRWTWRFDVWSGSAGDVSVDRHAVNELAEKRLARRQLFQRHEFIRLVRLLDVARPADDARHARKRKKPASVPYATLCLSWFAVSARTSCVIAACSDASSPGADAILENSIAALACSLLHLRQQRFAGVRVDAAEDGSGSSVGRLRNSNWKLHSAGTVLTALPPLIVLVCAVVKGTS